MMQWVVVDEFGFVVEEGFLSADAADKSRIEWENTKHAKEWNLKYYIELMPQ